MENIERLKKLLTESDAIVIGAGAGLSTSAGFIYSGERFEKWFSDFKSRYGFRDMYYGGFYVLDMAPEISWAYWARYIYINRYLNAPKPVYENLYRLDRDKDYFVITTNVDHCFQKAGFDKKRLFYTQGDYGLFQSVNPDIHKTYDNEKWVMQAMEAQGFVKNENGIFEMPKEGVRMEIPSDLIPKCPDDGSDMTTNLRADDSFVEDEGWYRASEAYSDFIDRTKGSKVLFLELGVGGNTPGIIKYPFWRMTQENENATYVCINYGEAYCPDTIGDRSICIDGDIEEVLKEL